MAEFSPDTENRRVRAAQWFEDLRDRIRSAFEVIETEYAVRHGGNPGRFEARSWDRPDEAAAESGAGGGGVMSIMKGQVFEKVGVNISTVFGSFAEGFRGQIMGADKDPRFWASGISLVAHMRSPKVPAVHMNTRHIVTTEAWFAGGSDLTPMVPNEADTAVFHAALKAACDHYDPDYYPRFREECDRYFFLPHRNEPRGVGGIFYDHLQSGDPEADFAFTRSVGEAFLLAYSQIVRAHMDEAWTDADRRHQLQRRGRYVEFNLLYDRGTLFGLRTGGNIDAILMSLPPQVSWP